jgi:hypothetical protein
MTTPAAAMSQRRVAAGSRRCPASDGESMVPRGDMRVLGVVLILLRAKVGLIATIQTPRIGVHGEGDSASKVLYRNKYRITIYSVDYRKIAATGQR